MLQMIYECVDVSTIFFAVVSRGAGIKVKDVNRLNKFIGDPGGGGGGGGGGKDAGETAGDHELCLSLPPQKSGQAKSSFS